MFVFNIYLAKQSIKFFVQFYSTLMAPLPNMLNMRFLTGQTRKLALEGMSFERAKQKHTFISQQNK